MLPLTFHWPFRNPVLKGNFYNKVRVMFSTIKQTSVFLKNIILIKLLIISIENKSIHIQPLFRIFRGLTGKIGGCS